MKDRNAAVGQALKDIRNDCGHTPANRGIDLDTGDDFCGDCGRVLKTYVPGTPGRFPGNRALQLIAENLKAEYPGRIGGVRLFSVDPIDNNEFWCHVLVNVGDESEHRNYTLTREGADENVQVARRK